MLNVLFKITHYASYTSDIVITHVRNCMLKVAQQVVAEKKGHGDGVGDGAISGVGGRDLDVVADTMMNASAKIVTMNEDIVY
nr:hypothetical protein [Tanacetum cinerariifolium]